MTLPASGAISMANLNTEFGTSGTISLNDANCRNIANIQSGAIALSNFYSKKVQGYLLPKAYQYSDMSGGYIYAIDGNGIVRFNAADMSFSASVATTYSAGGSELYNNSVTIGGSTYFCYGNPGLAVLNSSWNNITHYNYGSNLTLSFFGIEYMPNGNIALVGYYNATDGFIAVLNTSFAHVWARRLYGTSTTTRYLYVGCDSSSNIYAFGYNTVAGGDRIQITKYNSTGTLQWQRMIYYATNTLVSFICISGNCDSAGNSYVTCKETSYLNWYQYNSSGTLSLSYQYRHSSAAMYGISGYTTASGNSYFVTQNGANYFSLFAVNSAGNISAQLGLYSSYAWGTSFGRPSIGIISDDTYVVIYIGGNTMKFTVSDIVAGISFSVVTYDAAAGGNVTWSSSTTYSWSRTGTPSLTTSTTALTTATLTPASYTSTTTDSITGTLTSPTKSIF